MDAHYAKNTTVTPDRSKAEIEATLKRYGADQFMYGWHEEGAVIGFRIKGIPVRMTLPIPPEEEFRTYQQKTRYGPKNRTRTPEAAARAHAQTERQRWRALTLIIKAKLEAVESGITTFEEQFLAHMVLPDDNTVAGWLMPQIERALENRNMPPMLPEAASRAHR